MPFIEQLAQGAATQTVNAGMGLILGGINDRRQLRQQQKLQDMQIAGNKIMIDYQKAADLQMWKDTSYGAQKEQMEKAGVNPALLYGMSGGGGQTVGGSGSVSGASAPVGGNEAQAMMGMGIQYQLLKAQKENIEADTANKQADTTNKGKDTELKDIQISTQQVANEIAGKTQNMQISIIQENLRKIHEEADMAVTQNKITKETANTQIEKAKADLAQTVVQTELNRAQKEATEAGKEKTVQEIEKIKKEVEMLDNYWKLDDFIERKKVELINKGINVAMIGNIIGSLLTMGGLRR